MTICNTGALAAVERGTALGVIGELHARGALEEALPLETRPLLQGGRLTAWELEQMGAPFRLLVDGAAASVLARGMADVVLIGADRITANGDTANKVGSFSLALAARHAGVPFIVVAPESTVDLATPDGAAIEIEERGAAEVIAFRGVPSAPAATRTLNPAFDVTPAIADHRDRHGPPGDRPPGRRDPGRGLRPRPDGQARPCTRSSSRPSTRSPSARRPLCSSSFVSQVRMPLTSAAVSTAKSRTT